MRCLRSSLLWHGHGLPLFTVQDEVNESDQFVHSLTIRKSLVNATVNKQEIANCVADVGTPEVLIFRETTIGTLIQLDAMPTPQTDDERSINILSNHALQLGILIVSLPRALFRLREGQIPRK